MEGIGTFRKCGHARAPDNVYHYKNTTRCKICRRASVNKWIEKNPDFIGKQNKLRSLRRVSVLMKEQGGLCAICERELKHPYEDHNHSCCKVSPGCVACGRGLLCPSCNAGLHMFENTKLFHAALQYLAKWDKKE